MNTYFPIYVINYSWTKLAEFFREPMGTLVNRPCCTFFALLYTTTFSLTEIYFFFNCLGSFPWFNRLKFDQGVPMLWYNQRLLLYINIFARSNKCRYVVDKEIDKENFDSEIFRCQVRLIDLDWLIYCLIFFINVDCLWLTDCLINWSY